jgi:hypothetical protein
MVKLFPLVAVFVALLARVDVEGGPSPPVVGHGLLFFRELFV